MASRTGTQRRVIVALDGPASSGKSSVGSAAAAQLGLRFVDTGLFYRALTALALLESVPVDDADGLVALIDRIELGDDGTGRHTRVLLDGSDATDEARSAVVDSYVSAVARVPAVREALLQRQRDLAEAGGIVVAGRDIGTVVLPDADLKLYLDASVEERAKRRITERGLDPDGEDAEEVREQLRIRDAIDTGREVAPLRAADDAVRLDTDGVGFDDSVEIVAAEIARVMLSPRKRTRSKAPSTRSRTATAAAAAAAALGALEPEPAPVAEPEAGVGAEPQPDPEPAPVEVAPVEIDHGPFAVGAPASGAVVAHEVAGPFAVATYVVIEPYVPPAPPAVEIDPGPFAVDQHMSELTPTHEVAGPFAVASTVTIEPYALPTLPAVVIDPGPFAVVAAVSALTPAHEVAGPFAVASDVTIEPYVLPTPPAIVVDPGPFAVDHPASDLTPVHDSAGPFTVSSDVFIQPYVLPTPPAVVVDPGPFAVDQPVSELTPTHEVAGPFAVSSDIEILPYELPARPAVVIDPGPFAVGEPPSELTPAHVVAGPFAVSSDIEILPYEPPALPEAPVVEIDPGPFAVSAAAADDVPAHAIVGPFAVASDVDVDLTLPEPEPEPAPEIDPGPFAVAAAVAVVAAHDVLGPFAVSPTVEVPHAALPPEPEPEPEPAPEAEPEPAPAPQLAAAAALEPAAPRPVTPVAPKKSSVIETAMRLDNGQTTLVRMVSLVSRIGARAVANVQVNGLDNIPRKGAVILACNHVSNADAFVVGAWVSDSLKRRRIHWLGKRELFDWPFFGWMAANGGVHPVNRDSADIEAFRLATRILEKGYVLLVFPEGTRSPNGALQEAKDGVAMLALRTGAQVVPIGVNDSDTVWAKGQALPAPFPRRTIRVEIGRPFRVQDVIPEGADRREAKRLATRTIMGRIAELLEPRQRGVYADAIRPDASPEG